MSNSEDFMLSCDDLSKSYNGHEALNGVTCNINSTSLGLLGPNGSGKTTLIKLMLGLIFPTSGTIELNEKYHDIRVIPDLPKLPEELTVDEWIRTIEKIHGDNKSDVDVQTIFQLQGNWKIKTLSAGQRRKAALIPIFYGQPDLVVLDEPTNFLDIVSRERILSLLRDNLDLNKSKLILATHRLSEMRIFAKHVLILKEGKLVKTIKVDIDTPKSYTLRVDNVELLESLLKDQSLSYLQEETNIGVVFNIKPNKEIWEVLENFCSNGGKVNTFYTNDELKQTLEGFLN